MPEISAGSNTFERRTEPEPTFGFEVQELPELNVEFRFNVQSKKP
jgi:hypothetical protein